MMTAIAPIVDAPACGNITIKTNQRARRLNKMFHVMTAVAIIAVMMCGCAFAEDGLNSAFTTGMQKLWELLRGISYGIGVIALAIAAFRLVLGGQKGMESAKQDIIRIVLFAALLLLAPTVLSTIFGWFSSQSNFGTNPFPG